MKNRSFLRTQKYLLLRLLRLTLRHTKTTIAIFALIGALGLYKLQDLRFLLLIDDLIDRDFVTYDQLRELNREFDDAYNLLVFVSPKEPSTALNDRHVCNFWSWIQKTTDTRHDIKTVFSTLDARRVFEDKGLIKFEYLLNPNCELQHLEADDLALKDTVSLRAGLSGLAHSPWASLFWNPTRHDLALSLYLLPTLENTRFGQFDTQVVENIMTDFEKSFLREHPDLQAVWAGTATYMMYLRKGYDQSVLLNLGSGLLIFVLLGLLFRSFKSGVIFLICYSAALIPTLGLMAAFGSPIDSLSNALPILVLIAAIEDFVYIAYLRSRNPHWSYSFRRLILPGFLTSVTTFIGFGSLIVSDLGLIKRFGTWAAIASIFEFLTIFILLPALFKSSKFFSSWNPRFALSESRLLSQLASVSMAKPLAVVLSFVVLLAPFFLDRLHISDSPERIFPADHIARQSADQISAARGWRSDVSLVFREYDNETRNQAILDKVAADPLVAAHESPYDAVRYVQNDVAEATRGALKRLWEDHSQSRRYLSEDGRLARALLYVRSTDIVEINAFKKKVDGICNGDCYLAGTLVSYGELGGRVLKSFVDSMGISLILILGVLILVARSSRQKNSVSLVVSALWGPFALLVIFLVFQVPVFFVTSIVISILVGLAGDNAIQFMCYSDADRGVDELGTASIVANFLMAALASVLFFSYFGALQTLAVLMIVGLLLSLFGDIWILRGLRRSFR